MSFNRPCNSSWTKEEVKIFENTLTIYFNDDSLLTKMEAALPGKSSADIIKHLNEDVTAIESGCVTLPVSPELQGDSNPNSKAYEGWRRGTFWSEAEHRSFLEGLAKYGRGDWRSISRYCVITRTPTQVASHAQKYFKRLKADPKEKRSRRRSILDITSADAEVGGTSQAVPISTNNESLLPRESTSPRQMIAFAQGESSGTNAAFVNSMNCLYPDVNDEFIFGNDMVMEKEVANESGFIEALIAEHKDEDNDINSIFDVAKAPTSGQ